MNYVQITLSGLAATFLARVVILWLSVFRGICEQKATGLGAFVMITASPVWILAALLFVSFLAASRIGNKLLTTVLFWIPTLLSALGIASFALITYIFILLIHTSEVALKVPRNFVWSCAAFQKGLFCWGTRGKNSSSYCPSGGRRGLVVCRRRC